MLAKSLFTSATPRAFASGGGATRAPRRPASRGVVSRNALSTSTSRAPGAVSLGRAAAPGSPSALAARLRPRGAVLSRAASGDADKYQLAAAVVRARSAQDDCLEMLLGEMSSLSREVETLRAEVEALRLGGSGEPRLPGDSFESNKTKETSDTNDDEAVVRQMMNALGVGKDDEKTETPPLTPSDSPPPPFPEEDFSEVPVAVDAAAWRGDGTDRSNLWPLCKQDEDDIYLMATVQSCMNDAGFWAGEEDEADFYFGPSTVDALCYFQASAGLPETGVCDAATWRALLGEERFEWGPPPGAVGFEETSSDVTSATQKVGATQKAFESTDAEAEPLSAAAASAKAWSETAVKALVEDEDASATGREDLWGDEKSRNKTAFEEIRLRETQNPDLAKKNAKKWPVLRPEDGGWETHKLQVLLDEQGYYSGEEDMEYWYFGTTTENALGTFQASNGIPDTGLTCANTWRALLGEERFSMDAKAALETVGDGDYPLDLSRQDRVFLLGENRFEDRKVA